MPEKKLTGRNAADLVLTLLVMFGTLSLAWLGLTGTKSVPASSAPADVPVIPENAFAVVVDAGHGGFDGGAVGSETGVIEAELNLDVAKRLANELTARGFYVIMTRSGEGALGETKREDMQARREIMRLPYVDLVVSVHMNKFGDTSISGPMVFYMRGSDKGKQLADSVMSALCEGIKIPPRRSNPEELFVLREPEAPSVLVECGFLSNPADEARLQTPEYRTLIARSIAEGLEEYVRSYVLSP